jgi:Na+-driven multidrug efflux pump
MVGSVALGLGVVVPRLGIVGVGIGTAAGNTVAAVGVLLAIRAPSVEAGFTRPESPVITKQLLAISAPQVAEGLVTTLVYFPFNALLLSFGTSVNAGYQIGRRLYQQIGGPLYRAYGTTASIIVGQSLGRGDPDKARFRGYAHAAFSVATLAGAGVVLFFGAEPLVGLLTDSAATTGYAVGFARTFAVSMVFIGLFFSFAGALRGASETRVPFVARLIGLLIFFLGFSFVVGTVLDYGVLGTYGGIFLMYVWWGSAVAWSFVRGEWALRATDMMAARADETDDGVTG